MGKCWVAGSVHAGPAQGLLHEPLLGEAGPPLARPPVRRLEHLLAQPLPGLVPQLGGGGGVGHLEEVLAHEVGHLPAGRPLVHPVEGEPGVPWVEVM